MPLPATEDENIDQIDKVKVQAVCPYIIDGLFITAKNSKAIMYHYFNRLKHLHFW